MSRTTAHGLPVAGSQGKRRRVGVGAGVSVALIAVLALLGCTTDRAAPSSGSRMAGFHRLGDALVTPEEARAIAAAHEYLVKMAGKDIDAYYCPKRIDGGYDVVVGLVIGYDARGNGKVAAPTSSVRFTEDWQRIEYIRW